MEIKKGEPPRPEIHLVQDCSLQNKKFKRVFKTEQYKTASWLCGCSRFNAVFCFPCLIFSSNKEVSAEWTKTEVTDLAYLSTKIKKRGASKSHMLSEMQLSDIGNVDVRQLLDSAYRKSIKDFNEQVTKNRYILS